VKSQVQPGSTAKLPLLVAACEAGRQPESRVLDLPVTGSWPSNGPLGYKGETTLVEAFAQSRNAAAVRLAGDIGVRKVAEVSRKLGIDPGPEPDSAFVLGTFSTSVMSMTAAYATVANGGFSVAPIGVLAVVDGRGQVRATFMETNRARVIPQRCIEPIRAVLREAVRSGTGRGAALKSATVYGKTGTTTGNADAWFIGWTEGRVLGIWMGKRRDAPGEGLAGRGAPSELFRRVAGGANELAKGSLEKAPARVSSPRDSRKVAESRRKPDGAKPRDRDPPQARGPSRGERPGIAQLRPIEAPLTPPWLSEPWSEIDAWLDHW
jgi:penicillin-binding protein 1A